MGKKIIINLIEIERHDEKIEKQIEVNRIIYQFNMPI